MTTDITELTGAPKHANQHRLSRLIIEAPNDELRQLAVEVEQYTDQLIEALEKAQQREHRAVKLVKDNDLSWELLFSQCEAARGRIAELEESHAQVIQSRDHYKRMSEEGLKQLAESRTVTVKPMRPGHITVGGEKIGIYMRDEVDEFIASLAAAGIKWEAE